MVSSQEAVTDERVTEAKGGESGPQTARLDRDAGGSEDSCGAAGSM